MSGNFNLGIAIEIVVAVLLVLTIFYCAVLNRRLTRLRADEEILRATISELITATEIAERAIFGLRATAAECEKSLGARMGSAEELLGNLDQRLSAGNEIVKRIGAIVGAAGGPGAPVVAPKATEVPRESAAKTLQAAAEAAAERLSALRRAQREEAA
ncbi:DUF6468 domain-containing protein [Oryzibacter oryziterrae]|uniref:DUF6468 domain-containing protein n=1 Tax=Oryzibacter oryziterrae TaxID=2766474 RepID=UPI001F28A22C|nr:DUF6468 domain-containing protein [Oryzibacter oryziterrae]